MVARACDCYETAFQRARGVTQGDPLYPTIFNMVVYAVVRNWVTVVVSGVEEWGGVNRSVGTRLPSYTLNMA